MILCLVKTVRPNHTSPFYNSTQFVGSSTGKSEILCRTVVNQTRRQKALKFHGRFLRLKYLRLQADPCLLKTVELASRMSPRFVWFCSFFSLTIKTTTYKCWQHYQISTDLIRFDSIVRFSNRDFHHAWLSSRATYCPGISRGTYWAELLEWKTNHSFQCWRIQFFFVYFLIHKFNFECAARHDVFGENSAFCVLFQEQTHAVLNFIIIIKPKQQNLKNTRCCGNQTPQAQHLQRCSCGSKRDLPEKLLYGHI